MATIHRDYFTIDVIGVYSFKLTPILAEDGSLARLEYGSMGGNGVEVSYTEYGYFYQDNGVWMCRRVNNDTPFEANATDIEYFERPLLDWIAERTLLHTDPTVQ